MYVSIQSRRIFCPFEEADTDILLSSLTTLELGGPAKLFISLTSITQGLEVFKWLIVQKLPFRVLGGGSNLICADEGFDGVVVQFKMNALQFTPLPVTQTGSQQGEVYVEAGMEWTECV